MSIRICGGIYRSRKLSCPVKDVRPTSERVKEAIFSVLGQDLGGLNVLDLFAGSGNLGIEAISRGAKKVTFVDKSRQITEIIEKNLTIINEKQKASIVNLSVEVFLRKCKNTFDVIFMDPPYNKGLATKTVPSVLGLLNEDGVLVVEHSPREELDLPEKNIWKKATYGDTCVTYIRKEKNHV